MALELEQFVKTKIIATLGPASQSAERIAGLIDAGVDVFRLNMSHMDHDTADEVIGRIRRLSHRVAILVDLQGPKMRLTDVDEPFVVVHGQRTGVLTGDGQSSAEAIYIPVVGLVDMLEVDHCLLIDDGRVRLKVVERLGDGAVMTEVVAGGPIKSRKGVAAPDTRFTPANYLEDQDIRDIRFAVKHQVDFIAASYCSRAADLEAVRAEIEGVDIAIIAKIESRVGVENIDEIVEATDGVMVARGDLGVELPPEEVPLIQKRIIRKCNAAAKPVVVATQMLDSMINSPVASRAETSDVANAILDGTDAVMLSAETSVGKYPFEAVRTLDRISTHVEREASLFREQLFLRPSTTEPEFMCKAAARAAKELGVRAIIAFTNSGYTARNVAAYRPRVPILATSPSDRVARRLSLTYGVVCIQAEHIGRYDVMLYRNLEKLIRKELLEPSDLITVLGGVPVGKAGSTNMLQVGRVSELLGAGD